MSFFLSIFDLVVSTGLTLTRGESSFGVTSWLKNTHHFRIFLCFTVSEGGRRLSLPSYPNFESSKRKVRNLQLLLDSLRTSLTQETSVSPHRSTNSQHWSVLSRSKISKSRLSFCFKLRFDLPQEVQDDI